MSGKVFVDTNVLIYAHDSSAGAKQQIAQNLLTDLWKQHLGFVSMQVLQEFYVNVTRKLAHPLPKDQARTIVDRYMHWCVGTGPAEIIRAFSIEDSARISFWDALIVASAIRAGATRIVSEDLNPEQKITGILVENPFLP